MTGHTRAWLPLAAAIAALACVPFIPMALPGVLAEPLNSPGSLQLLSLCLVFAALATSYDLLIGVTGLLSFGHALYFAVGVYVPAIAVAAWGWPLPAAIGAALVAGVLLPAALGAVALRVDGVAFAMVTLAFAEAGSIVIANDTGGVTGGREGISVVAELPASLAAVANAPTVFWLSLAAFTAVYAASRRAMRSRTGRVWMALRESELRVETLGRRPYAYKLAAFVLSCFLATTTGIAYLLVTGGATPAVTTGTFTLTLLAMVVLGGVGRLWGAALGGALYQYLDLRLPAVSSSSWVADLPAVLRVPLSEPLFVLGTLLVVVVVAAPAGVAGVLAGTFRRWPTRRRRPTPLSAPRPDRARWPRWRTRSPRR